jgi:hypothetical protein
LIEDFVFPLGDVGVLYFTGSAALEATVIHDLVRHVPQADNVATERRRNHLQQPTPILCFQQPKPDTCSYTTPQGKSIGRETFAVSAIRSIKHVKLNVACLLDDLERYL